MPYQDPSDLGKGKRHPALELILRPVCEARPRRIYVCPSFRGLPSQAFEYILYNKGIMGEDSYPYVGKVTEWPQLCLLSISP